MMTHGELIATPDDASMPTVRVKLPWSFALGGVGALGATLIVMWSSVNKLTDEVRELKQAVQAGNLITTALQSDVKLLSFRQGAIEKTIDTLKEAQPRPRN